jgi:ABC-type glycerol-3-phosphate transport system substrate-binding protein
LITCVAFNTFAEGQKEKPKQKAMKSEFSFYHDNPEWQSRWEAMGAASKADINLELLANEMETTVYMNKIKVDLNSNRAPALFKWWFGFQAKPLVDAGLLYDLGTLWDEVGDNFGSGVRDAMTIDGFTYGIPLHVNYWVWYYSKPALAKIGCDVPKTWDEFLTVLEKGRKAGIYGIGNTIGNSRWTSFIIFQELLLHSDSQLYADLMAGNASYLNPKVVKVMELWKDLLDKGYFAPMDATYPTDFPAMMKEGSLLFVPMGDWYNGVLSGQGLLPGDDFGAIILPAIAPEGEGSVATEMSPLCIGKNAVEKEEALAWLKWYSTDPDAAAAEWNQFHFAPTDNIDKATILRDDPVKAQIAELAKACPTKIIRFWECTPVPIVEEAVDQFNKMLVEPDKYMEVLTSIEAKAKETFGK